MHVFPATATDCILQTNSFGLVNCHIFRPTDRNADSLGLTPNNRLQLQSLSDHYLELELNIKFPTCWDGERVESTDQSHVAYALECGKHHNECFDFDCPDTHPVR